METLTTIVEIDENEKDMAELKEEEVVVEKESSMIMALSHLSKLMGEIEEPKQDKENIRIVENFYLIVITIYLIFVSKTVHM